jgi:thiol-disulfide isomerase/thioredoxin
MQRLTCLVILGLAVLAVRATTPPTAKKAPGDESFESIKTAYEAARQKYVEELRKTLQAETDAREAELKAAKKAVEDAKTDAEKEAAQQRLKKASTFPAMKTMSMADGPGADYAPRFLAFAAKHPKDPAALDALFMALIMSGGPTAKNGTWGKAVQTIQADQVENSELKRAVRLMRVLADAHDDTADKVLRDVIARNPDRKAQGRACQALAQGRARAADLGERLKANTDLRRNSEAYLGGKDGVEKLIAGAAAAKKQAEELNKILSDKYEDVCPSLAVGSKAPEVVSQGLNGEEVKLSALKGKVVVLDIWATWCSPCRAMIPHEREMVARLKDKPFVLVSISADEKKETLTNFLTKEKMPWTHWWNGQEGGILEDWNVEGYPTIYVIDAKGVIRHRDLRGEKLEEAVNQLLKELESK